MANPSGDEPKRGLSVNAKISLGFSIVLALHISIAILGHYGLSKAKVDLDTYDELHHQVEKFGAIDRTVGALQRNVLLFAFTGYQGPEIRAKQLHDELDQLLQQAGEHTLSVADRASIDEMKLHLEAHCEMFEAVVVDRANRRRLVNEVLTQHAKDFDTSMRKLTGADSASDMAAALRASFQAAELNTMRFINAPDSTHVRNAKANLADAKKLLVTLQSEADDVSKALHDKTLAAVNGYETALIQMVQATRGYLHLVNVVLAGESEEFRRLAGDIRSKQSTHVSELASSMARDSRRFQSASNVFSLITIVLGVVAAWLIGREVAPPLNAITRTFDELTRGNDCKTIPGLGRSDELGRLAAAAQVFKDKAAETERLLRVAETSQAELNVLNQQLATQTALAKTMADEATAATLAKSEFLANMSHEIRTPMTAILGFSETIAESFDDPEHLAAIETIKRNGEHLLAIINDILDLSKVEAGKMTIERIAVNPGELVAEVVSLVKVKADGAGISLETGFEGLIPSAIKTDPTRLRQILINLLGNAIKFTEFGTVRLITRHVRDGEVDQLQFDIVDTGIGMTESQASRLFQPFSQADTSTTREFGGTGLGLTISKRFAEILGGDLELIETKANVGSRFRLTIETGSLDGVAMDSSPAPLRIASNKAETNEVEARLDGFRILLAEDGPDNQRLLSFVLKKAGAEVQIEENGRLATNAVFAAVEASAPFDCILMDMQMPVLGGYEATQLLRERGYTGPILALTAHAMDGDQQKCVDAGCDDYLTKPINRSLLLAKVAQWTQRARQSQTLVADGRV